MTTDEPAIVEISPLVTRRFLVSRTPGYVDACSAVANRHPKGEAHPYYEALKAGKPATPGRSPDGGWLVLLSYEADLTADADSGSEMSYEC